LGFSGRILGMDCSMTAPAAYLVDEFIPVPRCTDPEFVPRVLEICLQHRVSLVVPTIDTELAVYAACREKFARAGITVLVSSPETVDICADKIRTHRWFVQNGLPTVRQANPSEVLQDPGAWQFPLIAKPRWGSASAGVVQVHSAEMLLAIWRERPDLIIHRPRSVAWLSNSPASRQTATGTGLQSKNIATAMQGSPAPALSARVAPSVYSDVR